MRKQEPSAPESDDPDEDMRILTRDALSALAPDTDVRVRPVPQCARLQFVMYDIVVHNLQPCHGEPLTSRLEKLRSLWTHRFQKPDYLNVATTHIRYPAHHDAAKEGEHRPTRVKTYEELLTHLEHSIREETEVSPKPPTSLFFCAF